MKKKLFLIVLTLLCVFSFSIQTFAQSSAPTIFFSNNLAKRAQAQASGVDDTNEAYSIETLNDGNADNGFVPSWSSPLNADFTQRNVWAGLKWNEKRDINVVKLYMVGGYELKDYDIQVSQNGELVTVLSVRDNTQCVREHILDKQYFTDELRILCLSGSAAQPNIARLTEIQAFDKLHIEDINKDGRLVHEAMEELTLERQKDLIYDIKLPTTDSKGYTKIIWLSSDESVITSNGEITRSTEETKAAVLTAIIACGDIVANKKFNVTVYHETDPIETVTAEKWRTAEIELRSSGNYQYPYLDVDTEAVFISENGTVIKRKAFYDGENIWRIRFAPPEEGEWKFYTTSTNPEDEGLHNRTGKVVCTPYTGDLDVYKHGFIQREQGKRYLTYADGTPFLYIGDCGWMSLSSRAALYKSNEPSAQVNSMFKTVINKRAEQGYNAYRMNFFIGLGNDVYSEGNHNEGGYPWGKGLVYNISYSSVVDWGENHMIPSADRAFDGIDDNYWLAADGSENPWVQIDWKEQKSINNIEIKFIRDDTWNFEIVAYDGSYKTVYSQDDFKGTVFNYVFPENISTRLIRVVIKNSASGGRAGICEITPRTNAGEEMSHSHYFRDLNADFFKNADERIQYIIDKGMVADLGLDWGRQMMPGMEKEYKRFADYINARYGAYPVLWHTAGEAGTGYLQSWIEIAKYMKEIDSYNHVNTIHNDSSNPDYKDYCSDLSWHDMNYTQYGHNIEYEYGTYYEFAIPYWLTIYNREPVKPFIEGEALFEGIKGFGASDTRGLYWKSIMAGSAGFVYGAEGLWQATYNKYDRWQLWGDSPTPWYEALKKEAGEQLPYMKKFLEDMNWWELVPDANAIAWDNAPSRGREQPYQKKNGDSTLLIAYIPPNTTGYTGTANLKPNCAYTAKWYNTRTGEYTMISNSFSSGQQGTWKVPKAPDNNNDWALLIKAVY